MNRNKKVISLGGNNNGHTVLRESVSFGLVIMERFEAKFRLFLNFFPEIFKIHEVFNKIKSMSYFANKILIKIKIDFFPKIV